jgi:hypothetical protein
VRRVPPISSSLKRSKVDSLVTVALYNDDGHYIQPKEFDFAQPSYAGWHKAWFGVAINSFDAELAVDVDLSGDAEGELAISLLKIPIEYDSVGGQIEFQLYLQANASASMSFTAGLELSVS